MRIVVDIGHPAQVHYFKHFIRVMRERGHDVLVTANEKDLSFRLLQIYGFDYIPLGTYGSSLPRKVLTMPVIDAKMYRAVKRFKPDIFVSTGSIRAAHVAKMLCRPSVVFDDDEHTFPYYYPFVDAVCGLSGFRRQGSKIVPINGYKELAYLHPNWFTPDPDPFGHLGVSGCEDYAVLRFVAWNSFHDVGKRGVGSAPMKRLVEALEEHATVFISSELPLPDGFERYRLTASPEHIHTILYHARLSFCESGTMTTESALLGTPAVRCSAYVGDGDLGHFIELERTYRLIFNYRDAEPALEQALELLQSRRPKEEWLQKRDRVLRDKIDVTKFMIWFVETYPDSFSEMKEHPEAQFRFR